MRGKMRCQTIRKVGILLRRIEPGVFRMRKRNKFRFAFLDSAENIRDSHGQLTILLKEFVYQLSVVLSAFSVGKEVKAIITKNIQYLSKLLLIGLSVTAFDIHVYVSE